MRSALATMADADSAALLPLALLLFCGSARAQDFLGKILSH